LSGVRLEEIQVLSRRTAGFHWTCCGRNSSSFQQLAAPPSLANCSISRNCGVVFDVARNLNGHSVPAVLSDLNDFGGRSDEVAALIC